jgi:hypothetical protein
LEEHGSNERMVLPEELQRKMLEFFLKTSIPRKKQMQDTPLLEKDGGVS